MLAERRQQGVSTGPSEVEFQKGDVAAIAERPAFRTATPEVIQRRGLAAPPQQWRGESVEDGVGGGEAAERGRRWPARGGVVVTLECDVDTDLVNELDGELEEGEGAELWWSRVVHSPDEGGSARCSRIPGELSTYDSYSKQTRRVCGRRESPCRASPCPRARVCSAGRVHLSRPLSLKRRAQVVVIDR